ncbi:MAG TPA: carbamoyltransferase C-terminal domain-containing protein [Beijerinckiaceae bacterium]|jgi:carbamoyltransferase|nr:carbamoyltransferase C-terminal domain-containing protein [Beijerinckiaceae bacterium]
MAVILSVHWGVHDSSAALFDDYTLLAAVQKERLTRIKKDGGDPSICIDEVLNIAGLDRSAIDVAVFSRMLVERGMLRQPLLRSLGERLQGKSSKTTDLAARMQRAVSMDVTRVVNVAALRRHFGLPRHTTMHFANHHEAHALPALFHTDWDNALLYTADGYGDNVNYSQRIFRYEQIDCLFGDDRWLLTPYRHDSIARAYMYVTEALGFKPLHHEGKITGLAAFGEPALAETFRKPFTVDKRGIISSTFSSAHEQRAYYFKACADQPREVCAASIQVATESVILESINRILERERVSHIGLAGGLFANVKLNQRIAEETGIAEVFVVPPMGDEGLTIGGALDYLLRRDGMPAWLRQRRRLDSIYTGRDFSDQATARILAHDKRIRVIEGSPAATSARLIADGQVVATFLGPMEYGPRALGARSIMASPHRRDINDSINKRLNRTEFMPFAPVVPESDAADVFDVTSANAYASRFMTITCNVKAQWAERIPAVVHVDNTARPQIISRAPNPLYFDILDAFKHQTGTPVLINTSFNVHEQPIINTPEEAATALVDDRVDFLVTGDAVLMANR